jgi:hypothetical protein
MTRLRVAAVVTALLTALGPASAADAAPASPGPPTAAEVSATSVLLSWEPPATDPAPASYDVYRIEDGQDRLTNSTGGTSLLIAGLRPNMSYTYVVVALFADGSGVRSPAGTVTTPSVPVETTPPSAPGPPRVVEAGSGHVTLAFDPADDDSGIAGYEIYRTPPGGAATLTGGTGVWPGHPGTTWTGDRLRPDDDYVFSVVAVDWFGNRSAPTDPVTVRTAPRADSSCRAAVRLTGTARDRYSALLTVVNTGVTLDVWTIRGDLAPGQRLDPVQNWTFTQAGTKLRYGYEGWSDGFATGARKQYQLVVLATTPVPPDHWRLNGQDCTPL